MSGIQRVTPNLKRVLAVLLAAHKRGERLHGYAVLDRAGETPGAVYPMLRRLVSYGLLHGEWEDSAATGRASRRLYCLTSTGVVEAERLTRATPTKQLRRKGGDA